MPELPEVETVIRQLQEKIIGLQIAELIIHDGGAKLLGKTSFKEFNSKISQSKITDITRKGKFIIFKLNPAGFIVAHLRMTGRFTTHQKNPEIRHLRIELKFTNGNLLFYDTRRFATFHYIDNLEKYTGYSQLGPDAISESFNTNYLFEQTQKRSKSIYSVITDQKIVAGVGNIYANEALFKSKIFPLTSAKTLTKSKITNLVTAIKELLNFAINYRGTTLLDKAFKDTNADFGNFSKFLNVYDREKKACKVCGSSIKRIKASGRSVYYCPKCQK